MSISGEWSSDNGTRGLLNGQLIINSPGGIAKTYQSLHQFSAPSNLFKVGVNELRFEVDNGFGPTGLYVSALITETNCSYSITPTNQSHSSNTETGSARVRASVDCPWTASSNLNWINIVSGGSGNGDGTVTYAIMENTGATREGTLTIAGQTFTITQADKQSPHPTCSTTDDELVFTKLKEFYAVGEIVEVDLVACATSRFLSADLWVAIEMPSEDLLFMTTNPFEPFSLTPQVFRKSVKNTIESYHMLTFELPPDLGGKYTFYAVYVKEGKNPITDSFLVLLSYIGIAETTLSNR
ncbi:hypothetical protein PN36_16750 [Candidatus Thiomargarita nelsonii]|uniref:BACON domain-containing protein n=1 Tax=Candidatus Thiomargarita nelsonii TaxID=1003181 RepID=A0A0A6PCX2_9GAMM|nr:hypothetical protein PN36_16750 [Candidatus Thiomargarita nelsonii]